MYDLMYVDPDTIQLDERFPDTKTFVVSYKKTSTPESFPKHFLGFSYIRS